MRELCIRRQKSHCSPCTGSRPTSRMGAQPIEGQALVFFAGSGAGHAAMRIKSPLEQNAGGGSSYLRQYARRFCFTLRRHESRVVRTSPTARFRRRIRHPLKSHIGQARAESETTKSCAARPSVRSPDSKPLRSYPRSIYVNRDLQSWKSSVILLLLPGKLDATPAPSD